MVPKNSLAIYIATSIRLQKKEKYLMKKLILFTVATLLLSACNSIYVKPNTMEPGAKIMVRRGGYGMKRTIKSALEQRGFDVVVGKTTYFGDEYERVNISGDTRYIVRVEERPEKFNPFWCPLNGFWWWNFNISISDQTTGKEILSWRARGCEDSSTRLLNKTLDKMIIKQ